MDDRAAVVQADAYYLDDRLSLAESTCRFSSDGRARETLEEGFYVLAIRRRGLRDCLFRFSKRNRRDADSMLESLNIAAAAEARPVVAAPPPLPLPHPGRHASVQGRSDSPG